MSDGTVFRSMVLTERHSVLIAYGVSAPDHFEKVHDGSYRLVVENSDIVSLMGVTTIGAWRALPSRSSSGRIRCRARSSVLRRAMHR